MAVANGSVGLELAVAALNLPKGSEVIVTPRSYVTSVTCVVRNKLKPIFADVDLWSQNLSLEHIKKKNYLQNKSNNFSSFSRHALRYVSYFRIN